MFKSLRLLGSELCLSHLDYRNLNYVKSLRLLGSELCLSHF